MTKERRVPGELLLSEEPVALGPHTGQELLVCNTGDRPIQVGSHYHLAAATRRWRWTATPPPGCGWQSRPAPRCALNPVSNEWCGLCH
jgi:urease beta subunit-like protein